ncbi:MAG: hypothetical protein U5L01_07420 [Rheinheimera sp.]|nr:hypothetical protein [Rheinheimera sp.]
MAQNNFGLFGFGFEALLGSGANAGTLTPGLDNHALNATALAIPEKPLHMIWMMVFQRILIPSLLPVSAPATAVPVTFYAAVMLPTTTIQIRVIISTPPVRL